MSVLPSVVETVVRMACSCKHILTKDAVRNCKETHWVIKSKQTIKESQEGLREARRKEGRIQRKCTRMGEESGRKHPREASCSVTSAYAKKKMSKETKKQVSHWCGVFSATACDVSAVLSELV